MKVFELLGAKVYDVITGFEGIATSVSFDLYGCVCVLVTPRAEQIKEKIGDAIGKSVWFDEKRIRLATTGVLRAMDAPKFEAYEKPAGPQYKPLPYQEGEML